MRLRRSISGTLGLVAMATLVAGTSLCLCPGALSACGLHTSSQRAPCSQPCPCNLHCSRPVVAPETEATVSPDDPFQRLENFSFVPAPFARRQPLRGTSRPTEFMTTAAVFCQGDPCALLSRWLL